MGRKRNWSLCADPPHNSRNKNHDIPKIRSGGSKMSTWRRRRAFLFNNKNITVLLKSQDFSNFAICADCRVAEIFRFQQNCNSRVRMAVSLFLPLWAVPSMASSRATNSRALRSRWQWESNPEPHGLVEISRFKPLCYQRRSEKLFSSLAPM